MSLLESEIEYNFSLKCCFVGDMMVGKTCIIRRFIEDSFSNVISTVAIDFVSRVIKVDGNNIKITLYDTAGQERFRTIHRSYYKQSDIIIFVYDCLDSKSLMSIETWAREVAKVLETYQDPYSSQKHLCVLFGNKEDAICEKNPCVDSEAIDRTVRVIESLNFECISTLCSAKTGKAIKETLEKAFLTRIEKIRRKMNQSSELDRSLNDSDSQPIVSLQKELDEEKARKKGSCSC